MNTRHQQLLPAIAELRRGSVRAIVLTVAFGLTANLPATADTTPQRDFVSVARMVFRSSVDKQTQQALTGAHIPISGGVDLGIRWFDVPRTQANQAVKLLRALDPSGIHIVILYPKPPIRDGKAILPK